MTVFNLNSMLILAFIGGVATGLLVGLLVDIIFKEKRISEE